MHAELSPHGTSALALPRTQRAELLIDLDAIRHNVAALAGPAARAGAGMIAVVKGDAYGHGAVPVARAALQAGATALGVCSQQEAHALRDAGIEEPVLAWLYAPDEDFADSIGRGIALSAANQETLHAITRSARAAGRAAEVHLKIDTGLSRNGATDAMWPDLLRQARAAEQHGLIRVAAVWSHLAYADSPGHETIGVQAQRFRRAYEQAMAAGLRPGRHLANSACTLTRPDLYFEHVRPGIAIYGLDPVEEGSSVPLRPAMTFRSASVMSKRVPAGEGVSYGHEWVTPVETTLALVPVGYADGVARRLGNRAEVWLAGKRRPIRGRVCMDQIVVDCGDDHVPVGSECLLFGPGSMGEPTAAEWAELLETIHYEVVTGMGARPRVPRSYLGV